MAIARLRIRGEQSSRRMRGQDLSVQIIDRHGKEARDGNGEVITLPVRACYLECGGRAQPVLANLYCDIAEIDLELDGEIHHHAVDDED